MADVIVFGPEHELPADELEAICGIRVRPGAAKKQTAVMVCTSVDRERGVVTFSSGPAENKKR